MKRVVLLLLAFCMMFSTSCGKKNVASQTSSDSYEYYDEISQVTNGESKSGDAEQTSDGTASTPSGTVRKPNNILKVEGAGKDPDANYNVKGDVTVAVSSYRPADYEAMFDAFSAVYPNVNITLDYRPRHGADSDECNYYLSTRALSGNMPDVVFDDAGMLPSYLTQGWVYPLDEFVKNDSNFSNVPASLVKDYTYGGKLYALPHQAHFSAVVLNLDAFDELNMDIPSLSWNMNDFENVLKQGTNDKYSGLEYLGGFDSSSAGSFAPNTSLFGYDIRNRNFNMTSSYSPARKVMQKLRNYPGLEAYQLRYSNSTSGVTDYVSKFGNGNTSVMDMAFKLGRTLVHLDQGTWATDMLNSICKFNYELFPYPQATPGSIPIHADHCFMTSSAKNPEAAFQVLRYMTYSTEGNLARLSMYDSDNKGKYALNSRLYYPTTMQPDVAAKFKSLPGVTDVDKYFYDNLCNGYRVDLIKLVPGWTDIYSTIASYINDKENVDVDSLIPGLQAKANEVAAQKWSEFDAELASVQAQFGK